MEWPVHVWDLRVSGIGTMRVSNAVWELSISVAVIFEWNSLRRVPGECVGLPGTLFLFTS